MVQQRGRKPTYGIHITTDLETGEYEVQFENISHPGEGIVLDVMMEAVRIVLREIEKQHGARVPQVETKVRGDN